MCNLDKIFDLVREYNIKYSVWKSMLLNFIYCRTLTFRHCNRAVLSVCLIFERISPQCPLPLPTDGIHHWHPRTPLPARPLLTKCHKRGVVISVCMNLALIFPTFVASIPMHFPILIFSLITFTSYIYVSSFTE